MRTYNYNYLSFISFQTLPVSRSGWRPVVGSGGLLYSLNTAPLHQSNYKIPVPVIDSHSSYTTTRTIPTRETTKLSSVPQTYRTTTLRTLPVTVPNQPINSYFNPFALPNSAIAHFKYVGNYPIELLRNPYAPYVHQAFTKYPNKYKQPVPNVQQYQQLTNIQPIQFNQYQEPKPVYENPVENFDKPLENFGKPLQNLGKPLENFGTPVESFGKPTENFGKPIEDLGTSNAKKQQNTVMEIFKPEVYQIPNIDTTQRPVIQQVKTAQQQQSLLGNVIPAFNAYPHFSFHNALQPPSILGEN